MTCTSNIYDTNICVYRPNYFTGSTDFMFVALIVYL